MDELISAIEKLSNKTWLDYFTTFVPLILSFVAICISMASIRNQNKISLLDKRLDIYTNLQVCISNVIVEGKVTTQNANMFIIKARDVKFLFGSDVESLCKEIYESMMQLHCVGVKVEAGINGSTNVGNHTENCDNEAMLLDKMFEYNKLLEKIVSPYISFKKIRNYRK